jgi:hypothetical protein
MIAASDPMIKQAAKTSWGRIGNALLGCCVQGRARGDWRMENGFYGPNIEPWTLK